MKKKENRRTSKLLSVLLASAMLLTTLPLAGLSASADGLTLESAQGSSDPSQVYVYKKTSSELPGSAKEVKLVQYATVLGHDYADYTGTLDIPAQVEETGLAAVAYAVTEIGGREGTEIPGALENAKLSAVSIPSSVTAIGSYAFANSTISELTFPTSVASLDATAFTGVSLSKLTLDTVEPATLQGGLSYTTASRASALALPGAVTDLNVAAPLTVTGETALSGGAAVTSKLTVSGGASLTLRGALTGTGSVEIANNGTLALESQAEPFRGQIKLAGAASKLVNRTSAPVVCVNAKGNTVTVPAGEDASGDQAGTGEQPSGSVNRPQITVNYGGTVAVQEKGKVVLISAFNGYHVEEVVINGLSMGAITRYEFAEASKDNTVEVTFAEGDATEGPDVPSNDPIFHFQDVDPTGWYAGAISFMVRNKIFYGVSATEFAPSDKTTRAMFVTLLYRLDDYDEKYNLVCESPAPLSDVKKGSWYEDAAKWAVGAGVSPISGTAFVPSKTITREEIAVYLYNFTKALGNDVEADEGILDSYNDKDKIAPEAREAMAWAVTNGYLTGRSGDLLEPFTGAMRSEIAEILMRYLVANT